MHNCRFLQYIYILIGIAGMLFHRGFARDIQIFPEKATALIDAVEKARPGDTLRVNGGIYAGPIKIDKSIAILGKNWPVIDGKSRGSIISISAPGVTLKGLVIRNSGISLSNEDAGVEVEAPRVHIENNRIEHVLFGVYVRQADSSLIRNNFIQGREDLDTPRRGDLIRAWYSNSVVIEDNTLQYGRDVIVWFSKNSIVRGNSVKNARYGVHFMYSDDCLVENNLLTGNSVGVYLMYSRRLTLRHNTIAYNRGPSGFGIGVKDFDDGLLEENLIVDNRVGIFVDNSPRAIDSKMTYTGNVIAYNDIGFSLLSFVKRSEISLNSFIENYEQVGVTGPGTLMDNQWHKNHWSDYVGYDQDGDGIGDMPYKSEKLFENLMARSPNLRLFVYSPITQALEAAAKTFPVVKPQPKLADSQPLIPPRFPEGLPTIKRNPRFFLAIFGAILIFIGASMGRFMGKSPGNAGRKSPRKPKRFKASQLLRNTTKDDGEEGIMINAVKVTKSFGKVTALAKVSFEVKEGEAVALWGSNGAGKTTLLRCLLGIIDFQGSIAINGYDVQRDSRAARRLIGFVPQEISFHDNLTVFETVDFYARLKKADPNQGEERLAALQLSQHRQNLVKELSGGMKQRLALAIALLADPPILFLDEPTANLDMRSRDDFLQLLTELKNAGKTIVFSSHRLEEVMGFANRVLVLDQGKLLADAPPKAVYHQLGKRSLLRIYLPENKQSAARKILDQHGFQVAPNGAGIKVHVEAHAKALPIALLAAEGISVDNFDYEIESEQHRNLSE